jgi:hypothetical protein
VGSIEILYTRDLPVRVLADGLKLALVNTTYPLVKGWGGGGVGDIIKLQARCTVSNSTKNNYAAEPNWGNLPINWVYYFIVSIWLAGSRGSMRMTNIMKKGTLMNVNHGGK